MILSEDARTFALLAMANCDGLIASMEAKYHYNAWWPVTVIRDGAFDGNRETGPEPTWLPAIVTPPFRSYSSNHAGAAGAARQVLERVYGEHGHAITSTSPAVPGVVLRYPAREQVADDIDDARICGGIHFRFNQQAGAPQGRQVGRYILRNHLRPQPEHDDRGDDRWDSSGPSA